MSKLNIHDNLWDHSWSLTLAPTGVELCLRRLPVYRHQGVLLAATTHPGGTREFYDACFRVFCVFCVGIKLSSA